MPDSPSPLGSGVYSANVQCTVNGEIEDWVRDAATLEVSGGAFFSTGRIPSTDNGFVYGRTPMGKRPELGLAAHAETGHPEHEEGATGYSRAVDGEIDSGGWPMAPADSLARLRKALIDRAERKEAPVTQLCREAGISRSRFYELRHRYRRYGEAGLRPKPRRPSGRRTPARAARRCHPRLRRRASRPTASAPSPMPWPDPGSAPGG